MKRVFLTKTIFVFLIVPLLILAGSSNAHARLFSNNTEKAFDENVPPNISSISWESSQSIRELVIISAGYFLRGQGNINSLSEKVELSDIYNTDFYGMQLAVNSALNNIYYTWHYYQLLESKANHTPYSEAVITKLAAFDYDAFQEKNGLINDIFDEVRAYLISGDVRGVYSRITKNVHKISSILENVKTALYSETIPDNNTMWNLNQECAKTLLFGQYVARVFAALE